MVGFDAAENGPSKSLTGNTGNCLSLPDLKKIGGGGIVYGYSKKGAVTRSTRRRTAVGLCASQPRRKRYASPQIPLLGRTTAVQPAVRPLGAAYRKRPRRGWRRLPALTLSSGDGSPRALKTVFGLQGRWWPAIRGSA